MTRAAAFEVLAGRIRPRSTTSKPPAKWAFVKIVEGHSVVSDHL